MAGAVQAINFVAFILAIGVTFQIIGAVKLFKNRKWEDGKDKIIFSRIHTLWIITNFGGMAQVWWTTGRQSSEDFNLLTYTLAFIAAMLIVAIAVMLMPDISDPDVTDKWKDKKPFSLKEYYFRHVRYLSYGVISFLFFISLNEALLNQDDFSDAKFLGFFIWKMVFRFAFIGILSWIVWSVRKKPANEKAKLRLEKSHFRATLTFFSIFILYSVIFSWRL